MTKAIREVYGESLLKYGDDARIVVLDADVSSSTKSAIWGNRYPDRFFNCGIAEANMVAMAAGMAAAGKIPFVNTFGVFLTSIGLIAARTFGSYSQLPIKLVGAYGGLSDAFDGPSHHCIEDLSIMRALPNFEVYIASDAALTEWLIKNAVKRNKPMYIRLSRDSMPDIYRPDEIFEAGHGKIIRDGSDATIIACGMMVGNALQAAEQLDEMGIQVRVVDMFCIKPLDEELILQCAKDTGLLVTAEEHNIIGGLGSAVCEALCKNNVATRLGMVGLQDCHAECGSYALLQQKYELDASAIAAKVQSLLPV